ncbi:MAG: mannitol dehydrogenase family protein [Beijerinckiaceae bacterium]
MTKRLSLASLADLPASIRRPDYDPSAITPGIVHLGIGAFHRAHQAVYIDDLLRQYPDWAIIAASLRSPATADALNPQDGLYTVNVSGPDGLSRRIIGSVRKVLVCPADTAALLDTMSDPAIRIVMMTVTEKGYCHDPATGKLDEAHVDVLADLANPNNPRSVPGLLVEALRRRRVAGVAPFTVVCCDNLPSNGRTVKRIVSRFAQLRDAELGEYVSKHVAFPCTMVDRIVPATTDEDRLATTKDLGVEDRWPVAAEPFSQWVVEDHFPSGRPPLETVGVQMVADVAPFERMKLRMLNGSHSTLAYLGYLAGHETVAEAIANPVIHRLVHRLMTEEIIPTLNVPEGTDLGAYRDALLSRFANPGLRHRTWQIAMDGTQKLPQRLLGTIRDRLARDQSIDCLAMGVAGWMRYVMGRDEQGGAIDVRDPMAETLAAVSQQHGHDAGQYSRALFAIEAVFGADLPADPRFTVPVTSHLEQLLALGSAAAVAKLTN